MNLNTISAINETTDAQDEQSQVNEKTYTQKEFDDAMARMRTSVTKKVLKPYEDLGDIDSLKQLKFHSEQSHVDNQTQRGEFEQVLKDLATKKDAEISRLTQTVKEYKIDTPLLAVAGRLRSVSPDQVKSLLKGQIRLNESGDVEVLDDRGNVRYNDRGETLEVEELVRDFLQSNPHFVQPTPATTNAKTNIANSSNATVDIGKLDMTNPEHRKIYAEYRKASGII